jgi:hypothetical protein
MANAGPFPIIPSVHIDECAINYLLGGLASGASFSAIIAAALTTWFGVSIGWSAGAASVAVLGACIGPQAAACVVAWVVAIALFAYLAAVVSEDARCGHRGADIHWALIFWVTGPRGC